MKGFLYLVEIAVAGILAAMILGSFFAAQTINTDWSRADLVGLGNNVFDVLGNDSIKVLNESDTLNKIDNLMPSNVKYSIHFKNIPKEVINVGTNSLSNVRPFLQDNSYVNNRWIKYEITEFDSTDSLNEFDILVLYDYNYFGDDLNIIKTFSETKPVIGIENTVDDLENFEEFYDITKINDDITPTNLNFTEYNNIANYFLGIGFIVDTPDFPIVTGQTGLRGGAWKIENTMKYITASSTQIHYSDIPDFAAVPNEDLREKITGTNFFLKYIEWSDLPRVFISIKDTDFDFQSNWVSSTSVYQANSLDNRIIGNSEYSTMTKYENRIWIYRSPSIATASLSSEYHTLVQAAIASSVTDWYDSEVKSEEVAEVSRFIPLCCDISEIAEMAFSMWYVF
ncbi:MAG: hypothetical protein KJ906_02630 [Nanoarchaeota archaeon]|nr:hypothetical protein [Nanoarchaeota archaeon]